MEGVIFLLDHFRGNEDIEIWTIYLIDTARGSHSGTIAVLCSDLGVI